MGILQIRGCALSGPISVTKFKPSSRKILRSVLRFGMLLPDSILATEECGSPQRAARSRWERLRSWRRPIMVPTIWEIASASSISFAISGFSALTWFFVICPGCHISYPLSVDPVVTFCFCLPDFPLGCLLCFLPELMKKNVSVTQCYGKNCI